MKIRKSYKIIYNIYYIRSNNFAFVVHVKENKVQRPRTTFLEFVASSKSSPKDLYKGPVCTAFSTTDNIINFQIIAIEI